MRASRKQSIYTLFFILFPSAKGVGREMFRGGFTGLGPWGPPGGRRNEADSRKRGGVL